MLRQSGDDAANITAAVRTDGETPGSNGWFFIGVFRGGLVALKHGNTAIYIPKIAQFDLFLVGINLVSA